MKQKTIAHPISIDGFSVVDNDLSIVTLRPAPMNTGIVFNIQGTLIPATLPHLHDKSTKWTSLIKGGAIVHGVEHLLSALYGMGVTNLFVDLNEGICIPILDGSSAYWVDCLRRVGIKIQGEEQAIRSVRPIMVSEQAVNFRNGARGGRDSYLLTFPYPELRIIYVLDYARTTLKRQLVDVRIDDLSYPGIVASARTFMTTWEIERWRGSLLSEKFCDMVPKLSDTEVFKQRMMDEAAYHKVLDMVGDLALLGAPVRGLFIGICSGHSLNKRLVRELW